MRISSEEGMVVGVRGRQGVSGILVESKLVGGVLVQVGVVQVGVAEAEAGPLEGTRNSREFCSREKRWSVFRVRTARSRLIE